MNYVEIEVKAKTVDLAVEAAMQELDVATRDELDVQVISEPVKGFLGLGGEDAVVRVKRKPAKSRRRGRDRQKSGDNQRKRQQSKPENANKGKNGKKPRRGGDDKSGRHEKPRQKREAKMSDDRPTLDVDKQAEVAKEFLEGLVSAYGLEGSVTTTIEDDVIIADVSGDQTEAMVGVRGAVRSAIHELTRTVLQRYSADTARLRLDIAGYAERRRKALSIYAEQLIDQLKEEGGEIMLEPMSPADRKVIHDAAAEHSDVTSYSEGEPPRRFVVLSLSDEEE